VARLPVTSSTCDAVADALATYLGPNTARTAVRTFAERTLGKRAAEVEREDAPALLDALRPMLRTLLGSGPADHAIQQLKEAFR